MIANSVVESCTVTAFSGTLPQTGGVALGNPCRVQVMSGDTSAPPAATAITQCCTWELSNRSARVRCWGVGGHAITLCGHGLLSCASTWLQRWGERGTLWMGQTRVECHTDGELIWLRFPHAVIQPADLHPDLPALLDAPLAACATVGNDDGYLIAELPPGTRLERITPPGERLCALTDRALIVTCTTARTGTARDADAPALFCYRYFAPQHGNAEDTATGSAMRILAKYWCDKGLGTRLTAHQCSPRGGLLHANIDAEATWVGGSVILKESYSD